MLLVLANGRHRASSQHVFCSDAQWACHQAHDRHACQEKLSWGDTCLRVQAEFENSRDYKPEAKDWLSSYWAGFNSPNQIARIRNTGVPMNFLKEARGQTYP